MLNRSRSAVVAEAGHRHRDEEKMKSAMMDNTHFHRRAREETLHSPSICVPGLKIATFFLKKYDSISSSSRVHTSGAIVLQLPWQPIDDFLTRIP